MKKIIVLFALCAFVFSCQDDDLGSQVQNGDPQNDTTFQQHFGNAVTADFFGRVKNVNGSPIASAQVQIGMAVTVTDQNGIFKLKDVSVYENFAYVQILKDGYLHGSRTLVPIANSSNKVEVTLLQKNIVGTVNSGSPSEVEFNNAKVSFSGDFIDANGTSYSGPVEVSMHYLAPNTQETFEQMPGSLFAQTSNNQARALETYGMVGVELFGSSGQALNISEASPATVEFPIATEQLAVAPSTIPLWHFDTSVGYWKEDGQATRVGDIYVAEVGHFSWWNCDLPYEYTSLCINLELDGAPLPDQWVRIVDNTSGFTIFNGPVNSEGMECGLIPVNEMITLYVYGNGSCSDTAIHTEVLGPFSSASNVTINVPAQSVQSTLIQGTVVACDGDPIDNGYLVLSAFGSDSVFNGYFIPIEDSILNYQLVYCDVGTVYDMIVYDLENDVNSPLVENIQLVPGVTDVGTIQACDIADSIYSGQVHLTNQLEVNLFGNSGYIGIDGTLTIGPEEVDITGPASGDIIDLSPLEGLLSVGQLNVFSNALLEDLNGLEGLTTTNAINISNNPMLQDISNLSNLSGSLTHLLIQNNLTLPNLDGLEGITESLNLIVSRCDALTSVAALMHHEGIGVFRLWLLPSLNSVSMIDQVNAIDYFYVGHAPNLTEIPNLSSINGLQTVLLENVGIANVDFMSGITQIEDINFKELSNVTSLDGLSDLETLNSLRVFECDNLESVQGLQSITYLNEQLILQDNPVLTDMCALQNLLTNGTYSPLGIEFNNNAYNPSIQDVIDGNCSQ